MVTFKQLTVSAIAASVLLTGCAHKSKVDQKSSKSIIKKETDKIKEHNAVKFSAPPLPALSLPTVYEEPSIISNGKTVSFSATQAPLSKLLYIISKEAGMNLVIDEDVDINKLVTIHMEKAEIEDALDITMSISNSYIEVKGNILHVKNMMTRTFEIPFINMTPTTSSSLGGDMLGANDTSTGLAGSFTMDFESEEEQSDFYLQLEDTLEDLISDDGKFSLNKFSGTLVVTDRRSNVKQIEKLIDSLKKFIGRQVLIEAKIMEVILNDSHQLGVNWQKAWQNINSANGTLTLGSMMSTAGSSLAQTTNISAGNAFDSQISLPVGGVATSMSYTTKNFEAVLQAMQTAGSIEAVSNPRLKVMNGQSGVLASGNMIPYWEKEIEYTQATAGTGTNQTTTITPKVTYSKTDVLNGVSLGVTPIIKENGEVLLNIIPVITSIEGDKIFNGADGEIARAPIMNVKEAGTTILTKDNDMVVIGGHISSVKRNTEYKTPLAGDVPLAGNLFKKTESSYEKRELVIILKIDVDERRN